MIPIAIKTIKQLFFLLLLLLLTDAGPILTHCSAGVGRTGCYVVIDSMLERLKHDKTIDIYGHVTCLRAQRNYVVQVCDWSIPSEPLGLDL